LLPSDYFVNLSKRLYGFCIPWLSSYRGKRELLPTRCEWDFGTVNQLHKPVKGLGNSERKLRIPIPGFVKLILQPWHKKIKCIFPF